MHSHFVILAMVTILFTGGCGRRGLQKANLPIAPVPMPSAIPAPAPGATCTAPIEASIERKNPTPSVLAQSDVGFLVRISGGCSGSNGYLLEPSPAFMDGRTSQRVQAGAFEFSSRFAVGPQRLQSIRVTAILSNGTSGDSITRSSSPFDVTEAPPAPTPSAVILAAPTIVAPGQSTAISWVAQNAKTCQLINSAGSLVHTGPAVERKFVTPQGPQDTVFFLYCDTKPVAQVSIAFLANPVLEFSATLGNVVLGQSVGFRWRVQLYTTCSLQDGAGVTLHSGLSSDSYSHAPRNVSDNRYRLNCNGVLVAELTLTVLPPPANIVWEYVPGSKGNPSPLPAAFEGWQTNGPTYGKNPGGWDGYGELLCTGNPRCDTWDILSRRGYSTAISSAVESRAGFTSACGGYQQTQNGARITWSGRLKDRKVGAYAFTHGGGLTEVVVHTNFRTITLRTIIVRAQATFSPGVVLDALERRALFILRSYELTTYFREVELAANESVISIDASALITDNATCGANLVSVSR